MISKTLYDTCSEWEGDSDSRSELEQFPLTDCESEQGSHSVSELEQLLSDCESELAFYSHYLRVERIVGALENISKSLREAVKSLHAAPELLTEVGNETVHCAAPRATRSYMNPTKSSM